MTLDNCTACGLSKIRYFGIYQSLVWGMVNCFEIPTPSFIIDHYRPFKKYNDNSMAIKKIVEIFVSLMSGGEYEASLGNFNNTVDELISLSGSIDIVYKKNIISKLTIKKLTKRNKEVKEIFKDKYLFIGIDTILKFSTSIEIQNTEQLEQKEDHYFSFEYLVENYVQHLIIYSNLAKPGAFDTREGVIKIKEISGDITTKFKEFPILENSLTYAVGLSNKYNWPPIKELPLKKSLDWLRQHWSAVESISENKIQRALNAFSYLFHDNLLSVANSSGDLFHALIGIEAIYVNGNINIQEQVNQKSQILLGSRSNFKKVFSELYDYRSRYVHGQLNFINRFFVDDKEDIAIEQLLKIYKHSAFAIAILVSSLQKHIELDKNEFEFELILKK